MKSSPYGQDGSPVMRPSIVCYADILGYKSMSRAALAKSEGNEFLGRIHEALSNAHERIRQSAEGLGGPDFFSLQVFTDNIVVGYPYSLRDFGEPEMGHVFSLFAEIQAALAMDGFLLRGGIACGDHFMDEDVVFGDALLAAVDLDQSGGPPRLALASSAVEKVRHHLSFYGAALQPPQYRQLLEDADGTVFLNYLEVAFFDFPDAGILLDLIAGHQRTVEDGLKAYRDQPDVRAKYEWAARYHNFVCRDFLDRHPVPTDPDVDPEYAAAVHEARALTERLVDVEALAAYPRRISLTAS